MGSILWQLTVLLIETSKVNLLNTLAHAAQYCPNIVTFQ